ncbi:hypothetical protein ACFQS6_09180 [Xanthomonas populi]|uniref:hypothetical protein n=1 Tax=Xanthomonas populi TaxID=53414 RepID=UPI001FC8F6D8|nr:hypothetical protein [Xanthomonas populi]
MSQLKAAIGCGITAPSFHAALGPKQAVELALRHSAKMQCERGHLKGCMVTPGDERTLTGTLGDLRSADARAAESQHRSRGPDNLSLAPPQIHF